MLWNNSLWSSFCPTGFNQNGNTDCLMQAYSTSKLPMAMYIEVTFRALQQTGDNNLEDNSFFVYGNNAGLTGGYANNTEFFAANSQMYQNNTGQLNGPQFVITWNTDGSCGDNTTPPGFACVPTIAGFSGTQYHRHGTLMTTNGTSDLRTCSYIDDALQSCGINAWTVGGVGLEFIFQILEGPPTNTFPGPLGTNGILVQKVRIFSCPGWTDPSTTPCAGSTLVSSNGNTYWAPSAPANIVTAADNATNTSGAPADTISSLTFPFPITVGGNPPSTSEPERVIFWNRGSTPISITGISYTGQFSTGTTNCSGSLAANAYCYDWIVYTPTAAGTQTGTATLNFTGGSQAISLSGTGQSGSGLAVVNVSGCALPTMAANTTYVMGDVTCTSQTIHTGNGSTLQGDCKAPLGGNTIFNGNANTQRFANGLADGTTNVTVRCVTMEKYGAAGCPNSGGGSPQFDMNTGWLFANVSIKDGCGAGTGTHNGSNEIYHSIITHNAYIGGENQNSSGTYSDIGNEYSLNSYDESQSASSCYPPFDCGANKATNTGAAATFLFNGTYSHNQNFNAGRDPPGLWCDGVGTQTPPFTPMPCGALFEVENATIVNNSGDGIRLEIATSPGIFKNDVITGNGAGGPIVGACALNITVDNNYLDNTGSGNGDAVGGNYESRCSGSWNATAKFEGSGNIVVMRNTGLQWGMPGGEFPAFSATGDNNAFYTAGHATNIAAFNTGTSGNVAFSAWQSGTRDTHSTIQTGLPPIPPSGCTGDGTFGNGCVGSGMGAASTAPKITGVQVANQTSVSYNSGVTPGTILGAVTVQETNGTFNGTVVLAGTAPSNEFSLSSSSLPSNLLTSSSTPTCPSPISPLTIQIIPTQVGVVNSGNSFNITVTCNSPSPFPFTASSNGHYFLTAQGQPWQMIGFSLQAASTPPVTGTNSWTTAFSTLQAEGYNTVQTMAPCDPYITCAASLADQAGNVPFTAQIAGCTGGTNVCYDMTTPNEPFWARVDSIVNLAAQYGFLLIMDVWDGASCDSAAQGAVILQLMKNNGTTRLNTYGQFLGNRYKSFTNVWLMHGNDYTCYTTHANDDLPFAIAQGIKTAGFTQPVTMELAYDFSTSCDDTTNNWCPGGYITANGQYMYMSTYRAAYRSYNQTPTMPGFLIEGLYTDGTVCQETITPLSANNQIQRKQNYWEFTSGGIGNLYSDKNAWGFPTGWQTKLNTVAAQQFVFSANFFASFPWWLLVPDQTNTFLTAGQGAMNTNTSCSGSSPGGQTQDGHATAAITSDGTVGVVYIAQPYGLTSTRTVTINLAKFSKGGVVGTWYDPTVAWPGGTQATAACTAASPCPNSGSQTFTTPGTNSEGQADWVLKLTATSTAVNVLTRAYDNLRTGWQQNEPFLTTANAATLAQKWTVTVDDEVDASPLVLANQTIAGGTHDVLYIETANNTVYAFDAESGSLLLSRHISTPVATPLGCTNNGPNVGITGTPVIDATAGLMYLITYNSGPSYTLHAINVDTLADVMTQNVSASANLDSGTYTFSAAQSRQRPALLEANGNIYAAFGSFCDSTPSRGWVLGWNASTLAPLAANYLTNKTSSLQLTSIWMSASGIAADTNGNLFVVTANTSGDGYNNPNTLSVSAVKLSPTLALSDHWTGATTNQEGNELGSGGIMLLPTSSNTSALPIATVAGKAGTMSLLNWSNLSLGPYNQYSIGGCWCVETYLMGSDGIGRVMDGGGSGVGIWQIAANGQSLTSQTTIPAQAGSPNPGFQISASSDGSPAEAGSALTYRVSGIDGSGNMHLGVADAMTTGTSSLFTDTNAGVWNASSGNSQVYQYPVVSGGYIYVGSYKEVKAWTLPGH